MASKDFSTPSRQKFTDSISPGEENSNFPIDIQPTSYSASKRKMHNPLCLSSSKFQLKTTTPPPYFQDAPGNLFDSTDVTHSCVASEPINAAPTYCQLIEHLDLSNFKTKPCPLNTQHNHKHCPYYHNAKDRKRPGFFYSAELCDYAEKDGLACPNQDMCPKAHNRVEQLYRPEKYKTKFCTFYPNNLEKCEYGTFCSFAHNENDIAIDLIHNYEYDEDFYMFHFKTVWCPFNLTQHDKALCVYAHNWQDYRRKPNVYNYEPTPCSNWKSTDFILNYEDGCPFKEKCPKCHGWKEHEYHPLNYKSKPCPASKNCAKGRDCPHYHVPRERKVTGSNITNRVFRYVPRNRIVTNTFKIRSEERPVYNIQAQNMTAPTSASSLVNYPSLTFSQEGDSLIDQFAVFSDQMGNNPSRNSLQNAMKEMTVKSSELRVMGKDEFQGTRFRKQSYDFETNRLSRTNSMNTGPVYPKFENIPQALDCISSKTRRWSINEEGGFNQESDRLFREIVMANMNKELHKPEKSHNPEMKNLEEKEEAGLDSDLKKTLMLDKIMESEDT